LGSRASLILNIREKRKFTRLLSQSRKSAEFFVPNENGKDPEAAERAVSHAARLWKYKPTLTPAMPDWRNGFQN